MSAIEAAEVCSISQDALRAGRKATSMLDGKKILIVEDEPLIGIDLEAAVLDRHGCVVGLFTSLADALTMASTAVLDGAILDWRLNGQLATPLAAKLRERSIPFVVHSGHAETIDVGVPVISKPARPQDVIRLLECAMERSSRP